MKSFYIRGILSIFFTIAKSKVVNMCMYKYLRILSTFFSGESLGLAIVFNSLKNKILMSEMTNSCVHTYNKSVFFPL